MRLMLVKRIGNQIKCMKRFFTLPEDVTLIRDDDKAGLTGNKRYRLSFTMRLQLLTSYSASLQAMRSVTGNLYLLSLN